MRFQKIRVGLKELDNKSLERNEVHLGGLGRRSRSRLESWRYINNPESLVNGIHLEPGPSGLFQVVITIHNYT